jgi:hypothetical protein
MPLPLRNTKEPNTPIVCDLEVSSNCAHLTQIFTGFALLARRQEVVLHWRFSKPRPQSLDTPRHYQFGWQTRLHAVINHSVRVCYDLHDSGEIDSLALESSDLYFKRSFDPRVVAQLGTRGTRVEQLGLNFPVCSDTNDWFAVRRALSIGGTGRGLIHALLEGIPALDALAYAPRLATFGAEPAADQAAKVLFCVTAWNPADVHHLGLDRVEDRVAVNDSRRACVRALREAFGARFIGGFIPTPYARRAYPDDLLSGAFDGHKRDYLALVRSTPICVATDGLHGSIGWKFGEYVALSRAIVSTPLRHDVPAPFAPEKNYLEFSSPEQCVSQVERLLADTALRTALMHNNFAYYREFLQPDALVARSLRLALAVSQR